jgi:hypothetical protein
MVFPPTHPFHPQDGLGLGDGMISQAVDVLPTATPASPVRGLRFFVAAKKKGSLNGVSIRVFFFLKWRFIIF